MYLSDADDENNINVEDIVSDELISIFFDFFLVHIYLTS